MSRNKNAHPPDWIRTVLREAGIRRAIVLDGNVKDMFFDTRQEQYATLPEFLIRHLSREQSLAFTLAGVWDCADGLRFADQRSERLLLALAILSLAASLYGSRQTTNS